MRRAALSLAVLLASPHLTASALAQNLVANPSLVRDLPPPGWLADRRADWMAHHPVYQAKCRTSDVAGEIEFLNRIVGRDENLLVLAGDPPEGNSALAREAKLASREMSMLRNDIAAADGLVAQLQALPACAPAATATATPAAAATPPQAAATPAPQTAGSSPPATAPMTAPAKTETAAAANSQIFVIRFDDRVAALTPSGIHAFQQAVDAVHAGRKARIAIDGCATVADYSDGSACARRRASLVHRLAAAGIKNPRALFVEPPASR